eukprot:1072304-Prymnesium_polylepis.1
MASTGRFRTVIIPEVTPHFKVSGGRESSRFPPKAASRLQTDQGGTCVMCALRARRCSRSRVAERTEG